MKRLLMITGMLLAGLTASYAATTFTLGEKLTAQKLNTAIDERLEKTAFGVYTTTNKAALDLKAPLDSPSFTGAATVTATAIDANAVTGVSTEGTGVYGESLGGTAGVYGESAFNAGVYGYGPEFIGVYGESLTGVGGMFLSTGGNAIEAYGPVLVDDTVTATSFIGSAAGLTGIKTINGASILGTGDLAVSSMTYPSAGIPASTGTAWATPYTTSGTGTTVALTASPTFTGTVTLPSAGLIVPQGVTPQVVEMLEGSASGTNKVTLTLPTSIAADHIYSFGETGITLDGAPISGGDSAAFTNYTGANNARVAAKADGTHYHTLLALTDISITTPATDDFLRYNGTAWVADATIKPRFDNLSSQLTNLKLAMISAGFPAIPVRVTPATANYTSTTNSFLLNYTAPAGTSLAYVYNGGASVAMTTGVDSAELTAPAENTAYNYTVTATKTSTGYTATDSGTFTWQQAPSAPVITATPGDSQNLIALASGGTGTPTPTYDLKWGLTTGNRGNTISAVTMPYTHTGLTNSTPYYYSLIASNVGGNTESSEVTGTPSIPGYTTEFASNWDSATVPIDNWTEVVAGSTPMTVGAAGDTYNVNGTKYLLNTLNGAANVTKRSLTPHAEYSATFDFIPHTVTNVATASGKGLFLFDARTSGLSNSYIALSSGTGTNLTKIEVYCYDDAGATNEQTPNYAFAAGTKYTMELLVKRAAAGGGSCELKINGSQVTYVSGLTNGTRTYDRIVLGNSYSTFGTTGVFGYSIDNFVWGYK